MPSIKQPIYLWGHLYKKKPTSNLNYSILLYPQPILSYSTPLHSILFKSISFHPKHSHPTHLIPPYLILLYSMVSLFDLCLKYTDDLFDFLFVTRKISPLVADSPNDGFNIILPLLHKQTSNFIWNSNMPSHKYSFSQPLLQLGLAMCNSNE